jgi:hypothetical protein
MRTFAHRCLTILTGLLPPLSAFASPAVEVPMFTAYQLTDHQEASFDTSAANAASPFWSEWNVRGIRNLHLVPFQEKIFENKFDDEYDAQMVVKAAWGKKGVYLLCDVIDNDFAGPITENSWGNDAVDMFIYRQPAGELLSHPKKYFPNPQNGLIPDMIQLNYAFGKDGPRDSVAFCHQNSPLLNITAEKKNDAFLYEGAPVPFLAQKYGIRVRTIKFDRHHRAQEWVIPWNIINTAWKIAPPGKNTRFAFCITYNDVDTNQQQFANQTDMWPKRLSWGGRAKPYDQRKAWGDIVLGDSIVHEFTLSNAKRVRADDLFIPENGWTGINLAGDVPNTVKEPKDPKNFWYGSLSINNRIVYFATTKGEEIDAPQTPTVVDPEQVKKAMTKKKKEQPVKTNIPVFILDRNGDNDLSNDARIQWHFVEDTVRNGRKILLHTYIVVDSVENRGETMSLMLLDIAPSAPYLCLERLDALAGKITISNQEYSIVLLDRPSSASMRTATGLSTPDMAPGSCSRRVPR